MREIRTIEVDRWEPSEKKGMVKHVGMISPQEAFDALEKHLQESDLMPDEYFQSSAYAWDNVKELPNYIRASCDVNWGGSEGIYLDVSLLYRDENREIQRFYFATGKTLGTSGDDFLRMSRIAAECSMMLNGRGEVVRFQDENERVEPQLTSFDEREEQSSPLFAFIEKEVPFRMRELNDIDISDEDLSVLIDLVKENTDVMFNYDAFDGFLMERYEELLGLDRQEINELRGEISNLRHELDGAATVDPDLVPDLDKRLAVAECKLEAAYQGVSVDLDPARIIDGDHLDCFWYGGVIGSMTYKGYEVVIKVSGDVNVSFLAGEGDEVLCEYKNKNNTGVQKNDEVFDFVDNDSQLHLLDEQGRIAWENNNWVEFFVFDPSGKVIDLPNVDTVLGDDVLDAFADVGWVKEKIHEYEQRLVKEPLDQQIGNADQLVQAANNQPNRAKEEPTL